MLYELTDEWDKRGIKTNREYSILTAEISKDTFGLTPAEYKMVKGLKRENLREELEKRSCEKMVELQNSDIASRRRALKSELKRVVGKLKYHTSLSPNFVVLIFSQCIRFRHHF